MERKESRNGLELIKFGAIRLKGNFGALFMGAFAMVTPLVLVFLVPYLISRFTDVSWIMSIGVVLCALLLGPMQMGYIKYFNETIEGKQPKLSRVYSQFKFNGFTLRTIYISLILTILYLLGSILWIVTAGFAIAFFSMTLFFLEKYEYHKLSDAMTDCARQMIGNRLAMFSYKLIFYFVYGLLFAIGALCIMLIFELAGISMLVSYIVTLCSVIIFIFMYSMVTVYYHSCNQIFFEDTLMYNERKRAKLNKSKMDTNNANVTATKETIEKKENVVNHEKEVDTSSNATKSTVEPKSTTPKTTKQKTTSTSKTTKPKTTTAKSKSTKSKSSKPKVESK